MKELVILFAVMYWIGELANLIGYAIGKYCSVDTICSLKGAMTSKWLSVNLGYANDREYLKYALIGAPLRFLLAPISMIGVIGIMIETLALNMKVIFD